MVDIKEIESLRAKAAEILGRPHWTAAIFSIGVDMDMGARRLEGIKSQFADCHSSTVDDPYVCLEAEQRFLENVIYENCPGIRLH